MGVTHKQAFTFTLEHAIIIICCCCIVISAAHLHGIPLVLIFSSTFLFVPPSRQWSIYGKQFEYQRGGALQSRNNTGTERYYKPPIVPSLFR